MAFVTGTITNNMLDAIIPTTFYATSNQGLGVVGYVAGVTKNAYLDTTAKTVGYAYLNNIVARFDGTYWKPLTDATKILSGDFIHQVAATDIGGVSGNGLIYTGANVPFDVRYSLNTQFSVWTWNTASGKYVNNNWNTTNICRVMGMLLPKLGETTGSNDPWGGVYVPPDDSLGSTNGVPSHPLGGSQTAASTTSSPDTFYTWNLTSVAGNLSANVFYVRCVR